MSSPAATKNTPKLGVSPAPGLNALAALLVRPRAPNQAA